MPPEVGPGDFKSAFSLVSFNPNAKGLEQELVFALHELDRNPSIIRQGVLRYPAHLKRKGLGEKLLLIQIDEKGRVHVAEVVSSTHPDFINPPARPRRAPSTNHPKETVFRSRFNLLAGPFQFAQIMNRVIQFFSSQAFSRGNGSKTRIDPRFLEQPNFRS